MGESNRTGQSGSILGSGRPHYWHSLPRTRRYRPSGVFARAQIYISSPERVNEPCVPFSSARESPLCQSSLLRLLERFSVCHPYNVDCCHFHRDCGLSKCSEVALKRARNNMVKVFEMKCES